MGSKDAKLELLRRVPLFAGCRGGSLQRIGQLADEVDVPDGYHLMREGAFAQEFFLIIEGRVRIERGGKAINWLGPGEFLGEIPGPRRPAAVANGSSKLFWFFLPDPNSLACNTGRGLSGGWCFERGARASQTPAPPYDPAAVG